MSQQDRETIAQCLAGDESAFERLHSAHAGRVKAYLLRCGFAPGDADDLTQEVFLRVLRSLNTYDAERGSFRTWLGAIARNAARKQWSKRPNWDRFDPELAEAMFPAKDNPGDSPAAREEFHAVRACVESLPGELAHLVRLRYEDGRTTRSIAGATGIPESTVRARLDEARALLATCMKQKGLLAPPT